MKIGKIELVGEKLTIAIAAVIAAVALAVFLIFFAPLIGKLGTCYSACRNDEDRVVYAKNTISQAGKIYGDLTLMTEKEIPHAINELAKYGKTMGIDFTSIKPKNIIEEKTAAYRILPIEINLTATDKQFSDFLGSLDSLKKALVKVKSFEVEPDESDKSRLVAQVVISAYIAGKNYE